MSFFLAKHKETGKASLGQIIFFAHIITEADCDESEDSSAGHAGSVHTAHVTYTVTKPRLDKQQAHFQLANFVGPANDVTNIKTALGGKKFPHPYHGGLGRGNAERSWAPLQKYGLSEKSEDSPSLLATKTYSKPRMCGDHR